MAIQKVREWFITDYCKEYGPFVSEEEAENALETGNYDDDCYVYEREFFVNDGEKPYIVDPVWKDIKNYKSEVVGSDGPVYTKVDYFLEVPVYKNPKYDGDWGEINAPEAISIHIGNEWDETGEIFDPNLSQTDPRPYDISDVALYFEANSVWYDTGREDKHLA